VSDTSVADLTFRQLAGDAASLAALLSVDGAVRKGHYRLLSGLHTDRFLAFSAIAAEAAALDQIGSWLRPTIEAWAPDSVVAPTTAGVGLAATLARMLSLPLQLAAADEEGRPTLLAGTPAPLGSRVLLVNDVTTTGTAIHALASLAQRGGGAVAGAAWFASRQIGAEVSAPFPTVHVADLDLPSWAQQGCPLCATGTTPENAQDLN
jgi:orotate phosphoribosyltransferase